MWGNLLLGDGVLIGAAIDLADGAIFKRTPSSIDKRLVTSETASN